MAKFAGLVSLNGLPIVNDSVQVSDALVGAGVGLVGSAAIKAGINKFAPQLWASVPKAAVPALTGIASAAALYLVQKKSKRAAGHAAGALIAGVVLSLVDVLRSVELPFGLSFNDAPVALNLSNYGPYSGLLVNDPRLGGYGGLLVNDNSQNMSDLAATGVDHDDDYNDLVQLNGMGR